MALFQPYIDKARQEKKALVDTLYKQIQLCKHQCNTYYLCIIFKKSGPHYVIATGQPTKTYPSLTLFAITLENPHFYYTKEKYQLPPTEVGGLFLSSVVERLKADSLPKDSVL